MTTERETDDAVHALAQMTAEHTMDGRADGQTDEHERGEWIDSNPWCSAASATPPSLASCDQAIGARADVRGIERRAKRCRSGRSERPLATKQHAARLGDAKRTAAIVHTTPIYSLPLVFTTSPRHRPPMRAPHADIDPRCAHPVFNVGSASRRARRRGPARSGPSLAQRPARRHRAASRQSPCAGNLETPA